MKKVIVTGGAGFIGVHLVYELLERQFEVTVIDKSVNKLLSNVKTNQKFLTLIESDVISALENNLVSLDEFDVVFHLAGVSVVSVSVKTPDVDMQANLLSTFHLLERLRTSNNPPAIIFASSAAVYGNPQKIPIMEGDPTYPLSPYGVSKLSAERYIDVYCKLYDIAGATLRIFSVYGPEDKRVVHDIFRKLEENRERLFLLGNGSQERDFIYVEDVARALFLVADRAPKMGEVYNVGSGRSTSISQLAKEICQAVGVSPKIEYENKERPDDPDISVANIDRLKKLGFECKFSLQDGIKRIYDQKKKSEV
ncbi:MAG TPA: nucleoside-diphosphate sugar epimerase [Flavobacteriales bacterium]|nr:nucleoside-diphosphate sugar epimerase [Flavobacteriales bacterium]